MSRQTLLAAALLLAAAALLFVFLRWTKLSQQPPASACLVRGVWHLPNPAWTPGKLCSKDDPDYDGVRYPEQVAHCRRNVTESTKVRVAERYGYTRADLPRLEIDHLFELAAGGSNSEENLWAQPIDEAKLKDKVEDEVFRGMQKGTLTQVEAVERIREWRPDACSSGR